MTIKIMDANETYIQKLRDADLSIDGFRALENNVFWAIEEDEGKIIGAGGIGGVFNVPVLIIKEEYQGRGIGKKLLEATISEAKKRGYSFISGSRNPENKNAIKLHEYFGFTRVFRVHYYPGLTKDIIILILSPRGKLIRKLLRFFNTRIGNGLLAILLKLGKALFPFLLTLPADEYPDVSILHMIKNLSENYIIDVLY